MTTLRELLVYYTNEGRRGFVEAFSKQAAFYKSLVLEFKSGRVSIPGLLIKYLFDTEDPLSNFFLCG